MKLFPTGAGIVAFCISFVSIIVTVILFKKDFKSAKNTFLMLAILSSVYFIVGCCLFFRPPYFSQGEVYFSSKIKEKNVVSYLDSVDSVEGFIDSLFPNNEVLYPRQEIRRKDGSAYSIEHITWYAGEFSGGIELYTFDSEEKAKSEYKEAVEYKSKEFPDRFLKTFHGYHSISDHNGWSFCAFPVQYDGIRFLLPFVDPNGASFTIYAYRKNCYIKIIDRSGGEEGYDLFLPGNIFKNQVVYSTTP